jgi:hypothetical protein
MRPGWSFSDLSQEKWKSLCKEWKAGVFKLCEKLRGGDWEIVENMHESANRVSVTQLWERRPMDSVRSLKLTAPICKAQEELQLR